jgi:hypothetical protein
MYTFETGNIVFGGLEPYSEASSIYMINGVEFRIQRI